ncbi:MAG: hypothetical protein WCV85_01725 [Patescibacteria group bacterium]|jgi:hypothetical protein
MHRILKNTAICVLGLVFVVGLAGCKSAADNAVEKAIEQTTGTDAEVDASQNKVAINVNGTSWVTGDAVSLPTNFPEDIYVAEGTIKVAIASNETQGFTVSLESTQSVADLKAAYLKELVADGWTITGSYDIQGASSVMATKAKRSTTITLGANEDKSKTVVGINTYTDTSPAAPSN